MKKIASLILALGLSLAAFAQNITVTGVVLDDARQPVIGAFVVEQGTSNGTVTDVDGFFSFRVASGSVLEVSCIGYVAQTVVASPDHRLEILLQEDSEMLEETVVIGYGVQKKSVVTAAISSVTSDDLKVQSQTRLDNMLQGTVSRSPRTPVPRAPAPR